MSLKYVLPVLLILAAAFTTGCEKKSQKTEVEYEVYKNDRFRFELQYPKDLLQPVGYIPAGYGEVFRSEDRRATVTVEAKYNVEDDTLKDQYEAVQSEYDGNHELNESEDWFSVSGVKEGNVYYMKRYLVDDVFLTYQYQYPESENDLYAPVMEVMNKSFKF